MIHARTIRQQILYPLLAILIVLPVVIMLGFNIGNSITIEYTAKRELISTYQTMEALLNAEDHKSDGDNKEDEEGSDRMAKELAMALTSVRLSGNTNFYIFVDGEMDYPINIEGEQTAVYFQDAMDSGELILNDKSIHKYRVDGKKFFYKTVLQDRFEEYQNMLILFVTNTESYTQWTMTVNSILLAILAAAVFVSVILVLRISDSISRPIIDACTYAAQIGNGEFITVPVVKSNAEIQQFCSSLNAMSGRLKDYDDTQKQFLQNASHELRTPLMSIQGYAEGIENDIFDDPKQEAAIIRKESLRLNELVTELLTLSRIENHTYAHKLEAYDISSLILDYLQRLNGLFLNSELKVNLKLGEDIGAVVDEGLFSQTVINIVSNAIRYAKSTITISTKRETVDGKDYAVVEVADDGDGIAIGELPHLFERFYKGKKGNFGLGLAISKSAMVSMGGNLYAFNRDGAVFVIQVPYKKLEE